jgi:PsbP
MKWIILSLLSLVMHPSEIKAFPFQRLHIKRFSWKRLSQNPSQINEETITLSNRSVTRIASDDGFRQPSMLQQCRQRRDLFHHLRSSIFAGTILGYTTTLSNAVAEESIDNIFIRDANEIRYEIRITSDMNGPLQKPLKTHYDEVNFKSRTIPGYEIGITVDPVRIVSLMEFGTPEEVAAKVVLAEVNRDGVLNVKLLDDPISGTVSLADGSTNTFYQLSYLSSGKRGQKRFIAKFFIQNQKLLSLTVQCKDDVYETIKQDLNDAVTSFKVV